MCLPYGRKQRLLTPWTIHKNDWHCSAKPFQQRANHDNGQGNQQHDPEIHATL